MSLESALIDLDLAHETLTDAIESDKADGEIAEAARLLNKALSVFLWQFSEGNTRLQDLLYLAAMIARRNSHLPTPAGQWEKAKYDELNDFSPYDWEKLYHEFNDKADTLRG